MHLVLLMILFFLWKHRQILTSSGKPIGHHKLVSDMLNAIQLPQNLAIWKCGAHTNHTHPVSQGNAKADAAAKHAAKERVTLLCVSVHC